MADEKKTELSIPATQPISEQLEIALGLVEEIKTKKAASDASAESSTASLGAVNALLEQTKSRTTAFDSMVESSTASIQQELERVKTASGQVIAIRDELNAAKDAAVSARSEVESQSTRAKSSADEANTIKTEIATIKGSIESVQSAASTDLGIITQSKADIGTLAAAAKALSEKLANDHKDVTERIAALQTQQGTLQNLVSELATAKEQAEASNTKGNTYLAELEQTKDRFANLNSDTGAQYDALVQRQSALTGKLDEIDDAHAKVVGFRKKLLESSDDAKSVQDDIAELRNQINTTLSEVSSHRDSATAALEVLTTKAEADKGVFFDGMDKKFNDLHDALQTRILALLPSAGAAGLSSTYFDAKSRYAPTSYAKKPGTTHLTGWRLLLRSAVGYNPASLLATVVFYALFVGPVGAIVYGSLTLLFRMENDPHFVVDYKMLVVRALIAVPLATLSGFGLFSLQRYRRLYEQYDHKQRVMELYQSFGNEIAQSGDENRKKELLGIMLASVASKTWETGSEKSEEGAEAVSGALSTLERFADDIGKVKSAMAG